MDAELLEIVELANGDIVVQRADGEGEPLVTIQFSSDTRSLLQEARFVVARAMIEAGMEAVNSLDEIDSGSGYSLQQPPRQLH